MPASSPIEHPESVAPLPFELSAPRLEEIAPDIKFTLIPDLRRDIVARSGIPTRDDLRLTENRGRITHEQAIALAYYLTPLPQRPWLQPRAYNHGPVLDYVAARAGAYEERTGDRTHVNRAVLVPLDYLLRALPEDWPPWLITRPARAAPSGAQASDPDAQGVDV